jgi:hypothetical protein
MEYGFAPKKVTKNSKLETENSGKVTENSRKGNVGLDNSNGEFEIGNEI